MSDTRCDACNGTGIYPRGNGDPCINCAGTGRYKRYSGNPPRALVRCWHCLDWIDLPASSTPKETRVDLGEDVYCTSCGALVATCRPHTISIPERSLAL